MNSVDDTAGTVSRSFHLSAVFFRSCLGDLLVSLALLVVYLQSNAQTSRRLPKTGLYRCDTLCAIIPDLAFRIVEFLWMCNLSSHD